MMQPHVYSFLKTEGMHYEDIDLTQGTEAFLEEMRRGLGDGPSSLLMLPTYIQMDKPIPRDRSVVAMDAGGTNFRIAVVSLDGTGPRISNFQKFPMPGTQGCVQAEDFFDTIAEKLLPLLDVGGNIGFCFSFPAEILPDGDGKVLFFDKEVSVIGADGQRLGAGLNRALDRMGKTPKQFLLLNDTVATLLAGTVCNEGGVYDSHIGYILGTGTNTCYLEQCGNIKKSPAIAAMQGTMPINMESGCYARIPQGTYDLQVDATSRDPGQCIMEKMISGQYQGTVVYHTLVGAAQQGLFSDAFRGGLDGLQDVTMAEMDQFCRQPYGGNTLAALCGNPQDTRTLYDIVAASYERAAKLTAMNLAAIFLQTDVGADPTKPVCITVEGTTFYKSMLFRTKLDHYVCTYINDQLGRYCVFNHVDNASLIGSAVAALLH